MYVLVKVGGAGENFGDMHKEFMVDSESDLSGIDMSRVAPGSVAYTAGLGEMWQSNTAGQWVKIGA